MTQLQSSKSINALKLKAINKGGYHTMSTILILACSLHLKLFNVDLTPLQLKEKP